MDLQLNNVISSPVEVTEANTHRDCSVKSSFKNNAKTVQYIAMLLHVDVATATGEVSGE